MNNRHHISARSGRKVLAVAIACMLLTPVSCAMAPHHENNPAQGSDAGHPSASQRPTIARILADSATYAGRTVRIEGRFRGWQAPCTTSTALTRSDWVLDDGTGCIYVSGQLPSGLSPTAPQGERVIATGKIILLRVGKVNLQATTVTTP